MLDHIGFPVSDYPRSRQFYLDVLAPLGYAVVMEIGAETSGDGSRHCGFGKDSKPDFWIGSGNPGGTRVHVAFTAKSRAAVDAFHRAALQAGAADNGAPGLRPHYHPDYYGAFVLDPDGHNIEAVFHGEVAE